MRFIVSPQCHSLHLLTYLRAHFLNDLNDLLILLLSQLQSQAHWVSTFYLGRLFRI